jgi:hypothetical protein
MRNLILVFVLILPIFVFGQTLNDFVDFDSMNINLINNELYNKISETRKTLGFEQMNKDSVPIYAAKYHLTYFKQHKDLSEIHDKYKFVESDLYGRGYNVTSSLQTTIERLIMSERVIKYPGVWMEEYSYNLIEEKTFSYKLYKNEPITYKDLIDNIFADLSSTKLLSVISDETNFFGLWNESIVDDNEITYATTYVLTKK